MSSELKIHTDAHRGDKVLEEKLMLTPASVYKIFSLGQSQTNPKIYKRKLLIYE